MINVVSFAKPKEGKSTGSTGRSGFASTVVNNGGVEKHTLWGQSYNGRNDVTGDMTINGSLSNVVDITATGHISAPHFFQGGYPVLDSSNSHVDNGSVTIYNTTKYFLPTNSSGDVSVNVNFLNDVNVNGSLYAHDVSTDYLWANGGHITDLDASAISAKDITTEYLTVTKKAHFFSLIIDEIKSVGGQLVISPANATIDLVETLSNGDYRCYFRAKDKEGRQIHNQFDVDDQVVCQTFDVAEGVSYNVSNKYYWRKVVASYTDVVTKTIDGQEWDCHYIDISSTDYDDGSDIPEAGDKIAQLGNRTDTQRQDAIIISAYDSQWLDPSVKAPSFVQYKGINSYNLSSFRMNMFAANGNVMHGTLIVESGDNIEDLIDNVTEGLKPYPHVAYSNSSSDWTKDPSRAGEGWLFIGICFNYTESDSDLNYNSYRWMRMKGVDGQGIVDQHEWYLASSQSTGVTVNDNGWSRDPAQQQMTPTLKYLWNYEEYILTDGSTFNSTPHITGVYGEGHKVQDVSNYYLATPLSDGVTIQTAGWSENSATEAAKLNETVKYFWNYEVIHYTNGESTTVAPHISFVYSKGEKGDKGDDGSIGADGGHYEFIYKNAKTQPTAPTAGTTLSNLPTGWSSVATTPDFANGYYTWCSMCYVSGTGTYGTWSTPYRTTGDNGAKGEDGNSTEFIYKVTTTPTTPTISYANSNNKTRYDDDFVPSGWTDNPSGVDASSMYEWVASRVKESGTWSNFSSPAIWAKWGEKGEDGDGYEYIYILSETTPTISYSANNGKTKDDDEFVPTGWSDDPLTLSSSNPIEWVAKRKKSSGTWSDFSEPKVWAHWAAQGSNGGHYQFAYKNASTQPTKPTAGQTMTQAASNGWAENPSTPSDGQYTWMTQTFVSGEGTYGTWTDAVRITGAKGKDGEDGEDGSNGTSIEFIYTRNNTGTAPSAPATTQTDDWYGTYNGVTWTDNPTGVTSSLMYEYVSTRTKSVAGVWSAYSTPVIWAKWGEKGQDGDGYEYIFKLASSQPSISYTTNNGKTRYDDEFVPTGWYDDPQAMSSTNNIQWVAQRKKVAGTWSDFSTPVIWSRYAVDGSNGRDGSTGQNGQDAKTYSLADLGSQLIIDKDDKLYVNLTFGVLYVEGSNAQLLDSSDTPWSNVTGIKYKLNTDSSYTWLTANGSNGQFTKSRTISNYTKNNPSGAYAIVKLVINNIETDSLSLPITINPGSYYDTVGGLTSIVTDCSQRITDVDTSVTNKVSAIQQTVDNITLRVQDNSTRINNLDGTVSGHTTHLAQLDISVNGITSTVSSATERMNNLSLGATNMLRETKTLDTSFCDINSSCTQYVGTHPNAYLGFDTLYSHHASNNTNYIDVVAWRNLQTLQPDTYYTLSFYAKGYGTIYSHLYPDATVSATNSDGRSTTPSDGSIGFTLTSSWKRHWVTWKTPSSISGQKDTIIARQSANAYGYIYLCAPKLEKGNLATDWSPHPDDFDTKITSLSSSVSQIEQTASSISSRVSTIEGDYVTGSQLTQTSSSLTSTITAAAKNYTDQQIAAIDMSDAKMVTIDATGLSTSNAYPVIIHFGTNGNYDGSEDIRCQVRRTLNSTYGVPSYGSHQGGFVVNLDWVTKASAWGTTPVDQNWSTSDGTRYINDYTLHWVTSGTTKVVGSIGQVVQASSEVVYVRGGSKYDILTSHKDSSIVLYSSGYSWQSGTNDESDSRPVISYTNLVVPVEDRLGHSEIVQTANSIKLSVYDELEDRTGIDVENGTITLNAATTTIVGNLDLKRTDNGITIYDSDNVERINLQPESIQNIAPLANETYDIRNKTLTYSGPGTSPYYYSTTDSDMRWYLVPNTTISIDQLSLTMGQYNGVWSTSYSIYVKVKLTGTDVNRTLSAEFIRQSNGIYKYNGGLSFSYTPSVNAGSYCYITYEIEDYSTTSDCGKNWGSVSIYARVRTSKLVQTYIGTDGMYSHPGPYQYFRADKNAITMQSGFNGLRLVNGESMFGTTNLQVIGSTTSSGNSNVKPIWFPFYNYTPVIEVGGFDYTYTYIYYSNGGHYEYVYTINPMAVNGIIHLSSRPMDSNGNLQSRAWIRLPSHSSTYTDSDGNSGALPNGYSITIINDLDNCDVWVVPYRSSTSSTLYTCAIRDTNGNINDYFDMNGTAQSRVTKFIKINAYSPYNGMWFANQDC